jgi:hypothetical protein
MAGAIHSDAAKQPTTVPKNAGNPRQNHGMYSVLAKLPPQQFFAIIVAGILALYAMGYFDPVPEQSDEPSGTYLYYGPEGETLTALARQPPNKPPPPRHLPTATISLPSPSGRADAKASGPARANPNSPAPTPSPSAATTAAWWPNACLSTVTRPAANRC